MTAKGRCDLTKYPDQQWDIGSNEDLVQGRSYGRGQLRWLILLGMGCIGVVQFAGREIDEHAHECVLAGP